MEAKQCSSCRNWRLDRGSGRRICIGDRSDEYGDYTAGIHKCFAWQPKSAGERKHMDREGK